MAKAIVKKDEYGFNLDTVNLWGDDSREIRDENTLVTSGDWVLIIKKVPVAKKTQPQIYGIYWAIPFIREGDAGIKNENCNVYSGTERKSLVGVDQYGRQCALIYTPQEVKIFPDEYRILSPKRLEEYKEAGWFLREIGAKEEQPMNFKLINEGRDLVEEEREIIWALMLDGLTEQQSCEEYFLTHHTDYQNTRICYLPTEDMVTEIISIFGE